MIYDLIGIGIGPFNLSLAALLEKCHSIKNLFLDKKPHFDWHPELMFKDSIMQTSYLADLVTPVDPTSACSFLNYLTQKQLFYSFLYTDRSYITRKEFEHYCRWVCEKLAYKLKFNQGVREVVFENDNFTIHSANASYQSKNICVATGLAPKLPAFAEQFIGPNFFYAKSNHLQQAKLTGKTVTIIGAGQTGVEIFRNALRGMWGDAKSIRLVTPRASLDTHDDSPFTSDYFSPSYMETFWDLSAEKKANILHSQKLLGDGNTPAYLKELYNELYQLKHVENDARDIRILGCRKLVGVDKIADSYRLTMDNTFHNNKEEIYSDIVILCTGLQHVIPAVLQPLFSRIHFDAEGRFNFKKSYAIEWDGPEDNRIYALNYSRHQHGIADPYTSLMAWRSAVVANDLVGHKVYATQPAVKNFVDYGESRLESVLQSHDREGVEQ